MRDRYTGVCEVCGEQVSQQTNECPVCQTPVVWQGSRAWKTLYGSPDAYIRMLSIVPPDGFLGEELCRATGLPGFANQTEADRWGRAVRKMADDRRVQGIIRHAVDRVGRGRGALAYALNTLEKIVREIPKAKPAKRPTPGPEKPLLF